MTSSFKDSPSLTALLLKATPCTLQLEEDFKPRPFKPFLFQDPSNPVTLQTHVQTFGLFKDSSSPCTPTPQSFQQLQVQLKVHVQAGWLQRLLKQILKRQTLKAALPAMWCANVLICLLNSQANQLKETSNPLRTLKPQTIWSTMIIANMLLQRDSFKRPWSLALQTAQEATPARSQPERLMPWSQSKRANSKQLYKVCWCPWMLLEEPTTNTWTEHQHCKRKPLNTWNLQSFLALQSAKEASPEKEPALKGLLPTPTNYSSSNLPQIPNLFGWNPIQWIHTIWDT